MILSCNGVMTRAFPWSLILYGVVDEVYTSAPIQALVYLDAYTYLLYNSGSSISFLLFLARINLLVFIINYH